MGNVIDAGGNIHADPFFIGDYHLQGNSPCIDAGTTQCAPDHDRDGNPRPDPEDAGSPAVDMGAYEFGSVPSTTATTSTTTTTATTLPEDGGFVPPSLAALKCEGSLVKNAARLSGAIFKCHVKAADAAFKALTFDEEGCEARARDKYDKTNAKLFASGGCPACAQSNAPGVRAQLASALDQANGLAYCAGSVPLR